MTRKVIPKVGQAFNAMIKGSEGAIAIGCPCKATKVTKAFIVAIDKDDNERQFLFTDFYFVVSLGEK